MTTPEARKALLTGMPGTLDRIQDKRFADSLSIYKRGGELVHRFDLSGPARANELRAREILERERARPLSEREAAYVRSEQQRLEPILQRHGLPSPKIERGRPETPAQDRDPPKDRGSDRQR
ncbi:hypothetical protein [Sphingomonas cavernae]|uniref:hypothetical protein n=1 Tax=Sphingomonas cavernae TaxID=2320861 RepID=UPI003B75D1FB